jgi:hypothetical protein
MDIVALVILDGRAATSAPGLRDPEHLVWPRAGRHMQ